MDKTDLEAPLDAYRTAKPDEPTFTLQGGDPFAAPLVQLWAIFAREAAGMGSPNLIDHVKATVIERVENERDRADLLMRATAAEEVSWDMDAYRKGQQVDASPEISGEKLSVPERLDLHDLRIFAARRLSNAISEVNEITERLAALGFDDQLAFANLRSIFSMLRNTYNLIQPKRDWRIEDADYANR